jgi:hypothetical protein
MNLDEAAFEAVTMMRQLLAAVAEARSSCTQALADVTMLATQLDTDRSGLAQSLQATEQQLTDLGANVSSALSDAQPKLASVAAQALAIGQPDLASGTPAPVVGLTASQGLDAEGAALRQLAESVGGIGTELETIVSAAETSGQAALARAAAVEEALRVVMDEAEQLVSIRYASYLSGLRDAAAARAVRMEPLLEQACVALLDDRQLEWDEKLRTCRELLDRLFDDMETHADALVAEALEGCAGRVAQAMGDACGAVPPLETAWLDLETSLQAAAECLDSSPPLPIRMTDAAEAAHGAAAVVLATREVWRRQGFGQ